MGSLSPSYITNNHKLYFSKTEISKILNCYAVGVSNGNWKDYSINFNSNEAIFSFYKHTLASPDCILKKIKEKKRRKTLFQLFIYNKKKSKFENIDTLIASIKRYQISLL